MRLHLKRILQQLTAQVVGTVLDRRVELKLCVLGRPKQVDQILNGKHRTTNFVIILAAEVKDLVVSVVKVASAAPKK